MAKKFKKINSCFKLAASGISNLNRLANLPPGVLYNAPHFEINDNIEVIAEGCKGLLEYSENTVSLDTGKYISQFFGSNLKIQYIRPDALVIKGKISGLEFNFK